MAPRTLLASAFLAASVIADNDCSCFLTNNMQNDGVQARFQRHLFYNFTNIGSGETPPLVLDDQGDANKTTDPYFDSSNFTDGWKFSIGKGDSASPDNAKLDLFNTAQNAYVAGNGSQDSSRMVLRTSRNQQLQSGAEIVAKTEMLYVSYRVRARVIANGPGAVAGMYVHRGNANGSSLEILSRDDTGTVRANLHQPPSKDQKTPMPATADSQWETWDEWHTYRLDWTPNAMMAFVDDEGESGRSNYTGIPSDPTQVVLAIGGNGGDYSGELEDGKQATIEVQWIEIAFNESTPNPDANCGDSGHFCDLEEPVYPGVPQSGRSPRPGQTAAAATFRAGSVWMIAGVVATMILL